LNLIECNSNKFLVADALLLLFYIMYVIDVGDYLNYIKLHFF